jgi:hypothetical protein
MQPLTYEAPGPYRRLHRGVQVFYRPLTMGMRERQYLVDLLERRDYGGMFLPEKHPMAPGTVLEMVFHAPGAEDRARPVRARGMVIERRRWHGPSGMGILFLDFEGLEGGPLAETLDSILSPQGEAF